MAASFPQPQLSQQQHPPFPNARPDQGPALPQVSRERFQALLQRAQQLRASGYTPQTSSELDKIYKVMQAFQAQQQSAYCSSFLVLVVFPLFKPHAFLSICPIFAPSLSAVLPLRAPKASGLYHYAFLPLTTPPV
ncbi:hypothetical protein OBBRIDRAFT_408556 [Obba rivulosa]|uniref:Uncharacterized protein n=1 Tax=Obba rivulosa TaxID=1052685 RepID=A0A8E2APK6_9APHY|nr:hypothetical protein OBBRIDRAFT_408556 [Obba rivulosa]